MNVKFDFERGINDINVTKKDKEDLKGIFAQAGLILGGTLYESNFDIDKLDSIELSHLMSEAWEIARFEYSWRYYERQEI